MKKEDKIKVLCVKPEQAPEVIELENTIEAMQEMVGGYVEEIRTFGDPVVLICNEDGKCMGLPLNRMLYDDRSGRPYDILSGTFLVAGIKRDGFCSLSDDMLRKYEKMYHDPEVFYRTKDGVMMVKGGRKTQDAL